MLPRYLLCRLLLQHRHGGLDWLKQRNFRLTIQRDYWMIKKILAITAATFALGLSTGAKAQEINFGIISTESTQNLKQDWEPLIKDMEKQTGMKVTAFFAPDYAGIIEGMRFNKVQLAWLGNKSAMEAVDRASGEVFAQMVNADGSQGYYSHLIVHKDSPYNTLDEILKNAKSLSFGNGDPNSTSGFLVPGFYVFAKNNLDAKRIFKVTRSANHEANALAVANKQVDVATNNSENLEKVQNRYPEKFNSLKIVWTSPLIALDPLVMRKDMPESSKAKIKQFFYSYGKTDAREKDVLMKISKLSGFKESNNSQLLPIRQLDLFSKRTKIESDTVISEAAKKEQLALIDKQLAALN
jgi:phosphonate transport system substrate-binding protein